MISAPCDGRSPLSLEPSCPDCADDGLRMRGADPEGRIPGESSGGGSTRGPAEGWKGGVWCRGSKSPLWSRELTRAEASVRGREGTREASLAVSGGGPLDPLLEGTLASGWNRKDPDPVTAAGGGALPRLVPLGRIQPQIELQTPLEVLPLGKGEYGGGVFGKAA